jgi:hypothetical protein
MLLFAFPAHIVVKTLAAQEALRPTIAILPITHARLSLKMCFKIALEL